MVLEYDVSRAPLREGDFRDLVVAIVAARAGDESSWIEWKGSLDLRTAEGKAAVVRCIAGMSNRQPDAAARFCEGRGYMVVGAEPGGIKGVGEEDPADLSNWWTPYLGGDGPRWEPHWVTVQNRTVLVVEVAAPRLGDPMFVIRRSTTGVADGDIFVRRPGKTERASAVEIAALVQRAGSSRVLSGLSVRLHQPAVVRPVEFGPEPVERWVAAARDEALSSVPTARPRVLHTRDLAAPPDGSRLVPGSGVSLAEVERLEQRRADGETLDADEEDRLDEAQQTIRVMHAAIAKAATKSFLSVTEPEDRSPEEYRAQVQNYLDELRAALPAELRAGASSLLTPCVFALTNDTPTNLAEVRLLVHVPGEAEASEPDEPGSGLPRPPRPYGPRRINRFPALDVPDYGWLTQSMIGEGIRIPGVEVENGGSATLRFPPVHVRPYDTVPLPPVVLLLSTPVVATWEATSTGADGKLSGTVQLNVAGAPISVAEALAPDAS